jgi:[acyl-carrier-protein] S-malonyltransferase
MLTGFIFPAFVSEYSGNEPEILQSYAVDFDGYLKKASSYLGIDLTPFDILQNNYQDHELYTQFISYIFSCAVSDLLRTRHIKPDFISGYSMGIYGTLYCGQAVTFNQGLDLIRKAFELIKSINREIETGMGSIVGLTLHDIEGIIEDFNDVTITNTNGIHSHLISGYSSEIIKVLNLAKKEGALHAAIMKVTCPYHTSFLNEASVKFREYILKEKLINDSTCRIVSGIDQRILTRREEIIIELSANMNTKINWYKTMQKMLDLNVSRFIECGAGTSLHKIGKFIKGDFKIYPVSSLDQLFRK